MDLTNIAFKANDYLIIDCRFVTFFFIYYIANTKVGTNL